MYRFAKIQYQRSGFIGGVLVIIIGGFVIALFVVALLFIGPCIQGCEAVGLTSKEMGDEFRSGYQRDAWADPLTVKVAAPSDAPFGPLMNPETFRVLWKNGELGKIKVTIDFCVDRTNSDYAGLFFTGTVAEAMIKNHPETMKDWPRHPGNGLYFAQLVKSELGFWQDSFKSADHETDPVDPEQIARLQQKYGGSWNTTPTDGIDSGNRIDRSLYCIYPNDAGSNAFYVINDKNVIGFLEYHVADFQIDLGKWGNNLLKPALMRVTCVNERTGNQTIVYKRLNTGYKLMGNCLERGLYEFFCSGLGIHGDANHVEKDRQEAVKNYTGPAIDPTKGTYAPVDNLLKNKKP